MTLHEKNVLCEALTQYVENAADAEDMTAREREDLAAAERLLDHYTDQVVATLTRDCRALAVT